MCGFAFCSWCHGIPDTCACEAMSSCCLWTMQNVVIVIVQDTSVLRRECSTWTTFSRWEHQKRVATWTPCSTIYMFLEAAQTWIPGLWIEGYTVMVL